MTIQSLIAPPMFVHLPKKAPLQLPTDPATDAPSPWLIPPTVLLAHAERDTRHQQQEESLASEFGGDLQQRLQGKRSFSGMGASANQRNREELAAQLTAHAAVEDAEMPCTLPWTVSLPQDMFGLQVDGRFLGDDVFHSLGC